MDLDQTDFKQKAEEKKMSMSKNIARLAVTAGLTAALSFGGVMAPVTMAFAEGGTAASYVPTATTVGNVTIAENTYAGTTFKGIQIFKATVTQGKADANGDGVADENGAWTEDEEKTLSDIQWATPQVEKAVKGVFANETGKPEENATAQDWADYITKIVAGNAGKGFKVDADSALDKIAKALEKITTTNDTTGWKTSPNGTFSTLSAGYWLFVTAGVSDTANTTTGNMDAYTSPIFAIVGGADVNAEPKKNVPNVTKAVKDDKDGTFGTDVFKSPNKSADSRMDQFIEYQLTGTVASNINTYSTYKYIFTDKLPTSMTPELKNDNVTPVVTVKIDDNVVKSGYEPTYSGDVLTVNFTNLKACQGENDKPIVLNDKSKVTVEYKAKLDSSKVCNPDGSLKSQFGSLLGTAQTNTVMLTYSNNPHVTDDTGTTVDHPAYDYTYGIDVTKVGSDADKSGNKPALAGVQFTLQESESSEYIKADGTLTSNKEDAILTTNREGKINVVGLDEGTYVLKEVKPAPGYNNSAAGGITFTITNKGLPANGDPFNPGCSLPEGIDGNLVQVTSAPVGTVDGKVHLTVTDQKGSGLPLTGLNGVTFTWIAGGAVLCIGVAHLIRSRKQAEESEQE